MAVRFSHKTEKNEILLITGSPCQAYPGKTMSTLTRTNSAYVNRKSTYYGEDTTNIHQ